MTTNKTTSSEMRDYHALEILSSIKGAPAKTLLENETQDIISNGKISSSPADDNKK